MAPTTKFIAIVCLVCALSAAYFADARAQSGPQCAGVYLIDQTFANGARWQMCWEKRDREGIVYQDIFYTPPGGNATKILASASIAQIHVPYDDDRARYHDVTDYGLGTSSHLNDLSSADCPGGTLLRAQSKDMVCSTVQSHGHQWLSPADGRIGESLTLFSVSHVGAYNYIPEWRFFDDGSIEPALGATGQLQRFRNEPEHGWLIRDPNSTSNPYGVSHLHNYFWRLDFDIGVNANDDTVEELSAVLQSSNSERRVQITPLTQETARSIDPQSLKFWRVRDNTLTNGDGNPVSYEILPLETGHRDTGPSYEPFTFNDLYVTRQRPCERFASHNPSDSSQGCSSNEDLSDFVDGESLIDEDIVLWFGLSFHHIPRDEDEPYMAAHWNRFRIQPRDLTTAIEGPAAPPCGSPTFDPNNDSALIVWQDCDGDYHVVGAAGGGTARYAGVIHSTMGFTSVSSQSVESSDVVDTSLGDRVVFDLGMGGEWIDEIIVTVPSSGSVCIALTAQSTGTQILAGPDRTIVSAPFNPLTLQPCTPPVDPGCGSPTIDPASDAGLFVWKACNGAWSMMGTGSSALGTVRYAGEITNGDAFNSITSRTMEATDILDSSNANRLLFDMSTIHPWDDQFSFSTASSDDLCVNISRLPPGLDVYAGAQKTQVTPPFHPITLQSCVPPTATCGPPVIDANTDRALFVWQDCDGEYHLVGTGGGSSARYSGVLTTASGFTSIDGVSIETSDVLDTSQTDRAIFDISMGGQWTDEILFTLPPNESVCVSVDSHSAGSQLLAGPGRTTMTSPFDPVALQTCAPPADPGCGTPSLDPAIDAGLFVWKACNGAWSIIGTGASGAGSVRYAGNIAVAPGASNALVNVTARSLESSDVLDDNDPSQVLFNIGTAHPWEDRFDFDVQGSADPCITITQLAGGMGVYAGPDKIQMISPFNPVTLGSCN